MGVEIIHGDCRDALRRIRPQSINSIITSPPYYGLRDYGVADQIGLEAHPEEFIRELVGVFNLARDALREDGTLWLNLGDTSNNRRRIRSSSHQPSLNDFPEPSWAEATKLGLTRLSVLKDGLKEKDAFGIPWAVALALRADGWYLRQEIIWAKNFGKPEPSKDRFPNRHEQIFLLSKSKRYYFDRSRIPAYANGSVWQVSPVGRTDHSATFSEKLIEPCVLAGCPEGGTVLDPFGGSGTTGAVAARLGRNAVLIELSERSVNLSRTRLAESKQTR